MIKRMTKRLVATITICCTLFSASSAKAFVWPCIDITQIASFISSVTNGLSTISNGLSQIQNVKQTIASVGSQISSMRDFMSDLSGTIKSIKEAVAKVTSGIKDSIEKIKETVNSIEDFAKQSQEKLKNLGNSTTGNVEQSINDNKTEQEIIDILDESKKEAEEEKEKVINELNQVQENINKTLDEANNAVEALVETVTSNENIPQEEKDSLLDQAEDIKSDITDLKENVNKIIEEIKESYTEEFANKVTNAYDKYSKAIKDYFDGKISKSELIAKGQEFRESISSIQIDVKQDQIDDFAKKTEEIISSIQQLEEDILNTFSNDKEYSDEDEEEETSPKPVLKDNLQPVAPLAPLKPKDNDFFNQETMKTSHLKNNTTFSFVYTTYQTNTNAKALYSDKGQSKPFLISKEFMCYNKKEEDIEKLKEDSAWFRTCVSRAKTELEFYPDANKDDLYEKYQRNGVYNHIVHDYSAANIVTLSKMKQFASSWRGTVGKPEDSEHYKLKKMVAQGDVDSQASGVAALSSIELWSPRIWSNIRVVDAISRAKSVVKHFEHQETLYIDNVNGRNPEVEAAISSSRGFIKEKKVFPNVMLYICGLKAEDISLDSSESEEAIQQTKEGKLKDCIYKYALGAGKGTDSGDAKMSGDIEEGKKVWRERQKMTLNDAALENLITSVINNYNSTKDYMPANELKDGELNIVKLQEVVKGGSTAREHYGAGAQINYYATQQLLNIIDADAVDLQTEILKDLPTIDFSFFPKE